MLRGSILVASLLAASAAVAQPASNTLSMGADSIGPLKRGSVQADVLALGLPFERTQMLTEGDPHTIYTLRVDGQNAVAAWFFADDTPFRLSTDSPAFSTVEGARVGNTLAELQAVYPGGTVFISGVEGLTFSFLPRGYVADRPTISFSFDTSTLTDDCIEDRKKCRNLGANRSVSFATSW